MGTFSACNKNVWMAKANRIVFLMRTRPFAFCVSLFKLFSPKSVCVRLAAPRRQTDGPGAEEAASACGKGGRWGWVRAQAPQTLWSRRTPFFFLPQTFYEADPCRRRQERAPRKPRATTSWKHFCTCYKWSLWSPRALTMTCVIKGCGLRGKCAACEKQ